MSASDSVAAAIVSLDGAITLLATAMASGPAAGPVAATAGGPFTNAGNFFQEALSQPTPETSPSVQLRLRDSRDGSYARAQEVGFASLTPWPFIFIPLGFILAAAKEMRDAAQALLTEMQAQGLRVDSVAQARLDLPNPFLGPPRVAPSPR